MWNPFKSRRDHELRLAQLHAETQKHLADTIAALGTQQAAALEKVGTMVGEIAKGQQKSAEVLQTWLEGFKVMEMPTSSVVTEEDEVRTTVSRALSAEDGLLPPMPEGLPPEMQLAWQLRQAFSDD